MAPAQAGMAAVAPMMAAGRLPDFVILGAQRCGTTALYTALRRHPQIFMPEIKEPRTFAFPGAAPTFTGPGADAFRRQTVTDWAAYGALFTPARPDQQCGEASPVYLSAYQPEVTAATLRRVAPEARLIALLRNPADRAYSAFCHHHRLGVEPQRDFRRALDEEETRLAAGWLPGFGYRANGRYATHLAPYLAWFPREQVRVVLYEDWRARPADVLYAIYADLGVDPAPDVSVAAGVNRSMLPRSRGLARGLDRPTPRMRWWAGLLPRGVRAWVKARLQAWNAATPPPLGADVRAELSAGFGEEIRKLESLLACDLAPWRVEPKGKV